MCDSPGARSGRAGDLMRHCSMLSGAILALAGALWQSAVPADAQPTIAEHGKSGTGTAQSQPQPRTRDIEHKKDAATPPIVASRPSTAIGTATKDAQWNQADIDAAKLRCVALLKNLDIVAIPAGPVREGDCGAPAPVQLISVGTAPQVSLSPPPLVTCDMAAALDGWLKNEVQPAAREILGGPVIRIEVMSAYSCRTAYARLKAKLSEHGRANALDIAMFVTERGEIAQLRSDWGDTDRDVLARTAIAAKDAAGNAPKTAPIEGESDTVTSLAAASKNDLEGANAAARPASALPGLGLAATAPALTLAPPSRLGGPRQAGEPKAPPRQRFLHRIHAGACRHFGTVLGPEANEAHRNHFHVDMAERPVKRICE
jgi:hypothetical protein